MNAVPLSEPSKVNSPITEVEIRRKLRSSVVGGPAQSLVYLFI